MRVAVLMGGTSAERDVSLASGKAVAKGLLQIGYDVIEVDTALGDHQEGKHSEEPYEGIKRQPPKPNKWSTNNQRRVFEAIQYLTSQSIDVVFIALHGVPGEDGTVQGMLELANLPYTGSGVLASTLAMDKNVSKVIFKERGIRTPTWLQFEVDDEGLHSAPAKQVEKMFGFPLVVKPNDQGSTVGLTLVKHSDELETAIQKAASYSREVLIERYIPGRELTVSILGDEALPVIEIHSEHGLYDYECKYTRGKSTYTVPAELPDEVATKTKALARKAFEALKCYGFGRVDMRLDEGNNLYCLEVNTIPGMTETSLVPKAAKAVGFDFPELVDRIVQLALKGTN